MTPRQLEKIISFILIIVVLAGSYDIIKTVLSKYPETVPVETAIEKAPP